jgi:hypothetical protein
MKTFGVVLTVLIAATIKLNAQTGADYYLPLCVGNYTQLHTTTTSGWGIRTTYFRFVRTENINGLPFFVEQGTEIMDNNSTDTSTFRFFWLSKDNSGNIIIGAYAEKEVKNLDSATVIKTPGIFFSNQFLTKGYKQTNQTGDNTTTTDSVVSVTATAGSNTNCIQVRETTKKNDTVTLVEDTYYAYHIGTVKIERSFPIKQYHVDELVNYVANAPTSIERLIENENKFSVYPNPASDILTLNISNTNNEWLEMDIYDITGAKLKSKTIKQNNQKIKVGDLNDGVYMVTLKSKGLIEYQKLVIHR